jgi:hypothetical protein
MNNIKPGAVVEYLNMDNDFKLAIITQNVAGHYYDAVTFSGREVCLGIGYSVPARLAGHISHKLANSMDEYLTSLKMNC